MLELYSPPRPMSEPVPAKMAYEAPSTSTGSTSPIISTQPNQNSRLGKQPLPRELDWGVYQEQVLDNYITEAILGESEEDLTNGPFSTGKAKFNDVLHELLAIQFARAKLEGTGRQSTNESDSIRTIRSAITAEGSGSKRNTQDTMLTVPPDVMEQANGHIKGKEASSSSGDQDEDEIEENKAQEIERPASRASIASSSSSGSDASYQDPDRPFIEGPIHTWLPAIERYTYVSKRQKIKRAIWKVKNTPQAVTISVKKAVMGEEPWSDSPYFLHDEYMPAESKGLKEKLKFEFVEPNPDTAAGKLYARACEPYFRTPGTTKRECASCMDMFSVTEVTTLECNHKYCEECLRVMVMTASQQEGTMPPSCCKQAVRPNIIKKVLKTDEDKIAFSRKVIEYDTTVDKRLFCPKKKCGAFIPYHPKKDHQNPLVGTCQKCGTRACRICKGKAHKYNEDCPQDIDLTAVLDISKTNGWKRCFRCRAMIELNYGCTHMTCRCGAEFCYLCGNQWSDEYGCPIGCSQADDEYAQLANEIAEAERMIAEAAEAAAVDPEAQERRRQEQADKEVAEAKLRQTLEDFKIQALLRTQKDEQELFNKYSEAVIFKLKQRHYEEMTDLQLEHVSQFLAHNSELEDRTIDLSQDTQIAEREFCEKFGLSVSTVKSSTHAEEFAALSLRNRQNMLQMKEKWDKELVALKYTQGKSIDKLRGRQDVEERVVYVELEERKSTFITDQRNALAKMIEFRHIATGQDFAAAEIVYNLDTLKTTDQDVEVEAIGLALLEELSTTSGST